MLSGLLMSPPATTSIFSYNTNIGANERCAFRCKSGLGTTNIKVTYRDGSSETKTVGSTLVTFVKTHASSLPVGATVVDIQDSTKIEHVEFWYAVGEFPVLVGYKNVSSLSFTSVNFSFNSPYIDSFKNTLKAFYWRYPVATQLAPNNMDFWNNLLNIESFVFENPGFMLTNHVSFLTGKTKLKTFKYFYKVSGTITDLPDNIEQLIYLNDLDITRMPEMRTDIFSRLYQLPSLNYFNFYDNYRTVARVDAVINNVYDITMANNIINKTFNVQSIGAVAPPSGVYDGVTDWVGGVPQSPRAKIWHMVNTKGHTWLYNS